MSYLKKHLRIVGVYNKTRDMEKQHKNRQLSMKFGSVAACKLHKGVITLENYRLM